MTKKKRDVAPVIRSRTYGSTSAERAEVCRSAARMIAAGSLRTINSAILNVAPVCGRAILHAYAADMLVLPHCDTPEGRTARLALLAKMAQDYDAVPWTRRFERAP